MNNRYLLLFTLCFISFATSKTIHKSRHIEKLEKMCHKASEEASLAMKNRNQEYLRLLETDKGKEYQEVNNNCTKNLCPCCSQNKSAWAELEKTEYYHAKYLPSVESASYSTLKLFMLTEIAQQFLYIPEKDGIKAIMHLCANWNDTAANDITVENVRKKIVTELNEFIAEEAIIHRLDKIEHRMPAYK